MTKNSSFTDKERADWHKERRKGNWTGSSEELEYKSNKTCLHCGISIAEGMLCDACE